ncbi:MAG: DNA repair exonuclease, partial [Gammaproteobacteria bacterium]|nr:DNA repair exonuclease [Gammaproteobacteria bacterium]
LDAPLGNLGILDKQLRADLSEMAEKAWDRLVELCIDHEASFLVLAGDVFHDVASDRANRRLQEGLERLADNDLRVFICHGNHDPMNKDFRPFADLPPGVERFEPGDPQSHQFPLRVSGDLVQISGVSYGRRHEHENLARKFRVLDRQPGTVAHIAVLHANVGEQEDHGDYAPCTYADLAAASKIDYWALGHIHKRSSPGANAEYCGNLQGRSFKPAECEPKGALVVPIEAGRVGQPRLMPCDTVRFVRSEVLVEPDDTDIAVLARIEDAASKLGTEHTGRAVAWRMTLTGSHREAARLCNRFQERSVLEGMNHDMSALLNGGGLCDIAFSVRPDVDREALLATGDLRSAVLKELDRLSATTRASDAANSELNNLLRQGLRLHRGRQPTDLTELQAEWDGMLDESPEFLDEVVSLAEQLLCDAFANELGEVR